MELTVEASLSFAIGRTAHLLSSACNRQLRLSGWDLSNQEHLILMMTDHVGTPIRMSELAKRMIRDPTTLKRQIGRMIELKLLATKKDPSDGRATLVYITELGRETVQELAPVLQDLRRAMFANVSPEDMKTLGETLAAIQNNMLEMQ